MLFRKLKANEVSCKIKQVTDKLSALVLLYKDARVDMAILDETFGPLGWQNDYSVIKDNLFCTVSVWDKDKCVWVSKSNVGTESQEESEKGEASDAFKRACTNWGIGRELYTAPMIYIKLADNETYKSKSGKDACRTRFDVREIDYDDNGDISRLVVSDGHTDRFIFGSKQKASKQTTPKPESHNVEVPQPAKQEPITGWIAKAVYTSKDGYKHLCTMAPLETVRAELKNAGATGWEDISYEQYTLVYVNLNSAPDNFRDDTEAAQK